MKEIDEFSGLLEGPRARGAFALRCLLASPWSLRIEADAPLTVIAMVAGKCHISHDNGDCVALEAGDVAITKAPGRYTIADEIAREPTVYIHPGQVCKTPDGRSLSEEMKLGVRAWGNDLNASNQMLIGSYESMANVSERLLTALPPMLWVKGEEWDSPLVQLLNDEMARDAPGQAAVLDRLLDMLLISILRTWFSKKEIQDTPWYQSKGDKVVGRTLKLIHQNPSHPWTLKSLSANVGVSRAALARRFNEVVGEPPMAFLTQWRLALAADLLCEPEETVGSVAERVGYGSPYALSSAFKRVRGLSPQEHRSRALAAS